METVLFSAGMLKRFIVINSRGRYARSVDDATFVPVTESAFSPLAKIEVERSTRNPNKYVHFRFCHTNKYWGREPTDGGSMVPVLAVSDEPEEDITKSSSTLFEVVKARNDPTNTMFQLMHVQSRGYVIDVMSRLYLRLPIPNPVTIDDASVLSFVNWDELIKLPKRIAFRGHNDKYLGGRVRSRTNSLHLSFPDGKSKQSVHEVHLMNDGHVRIKSLHFDRFWRRNPSNNWIVADATTNIASTRDKDTLFWPIHNSHEGDAIVLRNAGNNQFCIVENNDYLVGSSRSMTDKTKLTVEELVFGRKIYNVTYRVNNSRIFNQAPYVAGTTTAVNNGNTEASIAVEVTYEESKSESFTRSFSVTAGVSITMKVKIPFIAKKGIEFSAETTIGREWNTTTTTTVSLKATGTVDVPPRSVATISYIGTNGTCDVPFSYTQEAQSTVDGKIDKSEEIDGVFRGVNAYDFQFIINETRSLTPSDEVMLPAATEPIVSEPQ